MIGTLTLSRNRDHPNAVSVILGVAALLCVHGGMAAVQRVVAATALESKDPDNSVGFSRPSPQWPYHQIHATLGPADGSAVTIEAISVNGNQIREYEIEQIAADLADGRHIPQRNAHDGVIAAGARFSITAPLRWSHGEEVRVAVVAKTMSGETKKLSASAKPSWNGYWNADWKYEAAIVVRETAGVPRRNEPVEVTLGLLRHRLTDPRRELRVVTPKTNGSSEYDEVPCQILDIVEWNDPDRINSDEKDAQTGAPIRRYIATTTLQFVFAADVEAYAQRVYLICYGNPNASTPSYSSHLKIEKGQDLGQTVSNRHYRMGLATNSAAVETVVVKGGGAEVLLEHKIETNGAVHWNPGVYSPPTPWVHVSDWENPESSTLTGPVMHRVRRYADMPHMAEVAAHVTYEFFADQPYLLSSSVMEVKQDIMVQALRNGEIVFNHAVLDEFVWKDALGKIHRQPLADTKKHPIHALEIPAASPWLAFISREAGVGFAGINVDYQNVNLYGHPISAAQPYFYVQNGPWIYWARGIVYPFGHLNYTRMMPVRRGSLYIETIAYLPFRLGKGPDPFAEVDRVHTVTTQPLQIREWIDLAPETPDGWIMPLLTAPFDEGVQGAKSSREVPEK